MTDSLALLQTVSVERSETSTQGQFHKGRRRSGRKQRGSKTAEDDVPLSHADETAMALPLNGYDSQQFVNRGTLSTKPYMEQVPVRLQLADLTKTSAASGPSSHCVPGPGHAIDLARSQSPACYPQNSDPEGWQKQVDFVLSKAELAAAVDKCSAVLHLEVFESIGGRVCKLSFDSNGCRLVQRALSILDHEHQVKLAKELANHVHQAMEDLHGNHVLQKCITLLPITCVEFMLEELKQSISSANLAKHRYGCRVLERFLEHCPTGSLDEYLLPVIENAQNLSKNKFGNFVIQHVIEHGTEMQKRSIVEMLTANMREMATDTHGCSVLGKALVYTKFPQELADAIVNSDGLIVEMATSRDGNGGFEATERLLTVLLLQGGRETETFQKARQQLLPRLAELQATKNGRHIVSMLTAGG